MRMLREQDYDLGVTYYPGKANRVAGDLNRSVPQKVTLLRLVVQESWRTNLKLRGLASWFQWRSGRLSVGSLVSLEGVS